MHKTANEDIVCYKLMSYAQVQWRTPFQSFPVALDIVQGKKDFCADDGWKGFPKDVVPTLYSKLFYVGGGYIHTYASEISAKAEKEHYQTNHIHLSVFECIIPKGTKYLEGRDSDFERGYASERIRFVKKIYG
jgi:hypothetical protein